MVALYRNAVAFLHARFISKSTNPFISRSAVAVQALNGATITSSGPSTEFASSSQCYDADFLALGMGGTNMMCMLWSIAMGKPTIGVEMRGDPFLMIHWNIREDLYHQLGLIDQMMMDRYGEDGVPRRADGKLFSLADCFYSPKTTAGYVVADEVITGYDKQRHIAGTIHHVEFIDDRHKDGMPHRSVTTLPRPEPPSKPDPTAIRTSVKDVLDGPSTFQSEANNVLILLRRYLEAVAAMDEKNGLEEPRVRLFTRHRVKKGEDGFVRDDGENGRLSIALEAVEELDFKGKLIRVSSTTDKGTITINAPELCVIAQGSNSDNAKCLGFQKKDVVVDHNDGHGPVVAQADYLAGFIDVLVDGRLRRRIASAFDDNGHEYWVRQIAVGHEGDPQVGWVLVQVPDYMMFDPVKAGYISEDTDRDSVEYFAAYQRLLYEFYIQEASKVLEIPEEELKDVRMAYGPKLFSIVSRVGETPRIAPNVMVAGDSFGNGHFLESGGAMTGMVGHSTAVLNYWKNRDKGMVMESALTQLADEIKKGTLDWLEVSAKEFSSFTPVNFGVDRVNAVEKEMNIDVNARAKTIDASRRIRHEISLQDPCDWRRPAMRNGRVITKTLPSPRSKIV